MFVSVAPTRRVRLWSTLLLLSCAWPVVAAESTPAAPPNAPAIVAADAVQEAFVRAAELVKPSIVTIYADRAGDDSSSNGETSPLTPPDAAKNRAGLGTGMVVDPQGAIVTNYHVVKGANSIHVVFNADSERRVRLQAKVAGFDEESDLAVLQLVDLPKAALQPVEFANSDAVRVGEWAIAVGAPFDQAQTITVGIVSAKSRQLEKNDRPTLQEYLQTDASINPGNSGGPLLNLAGKVIGINTAILSPSQFNVGIGFALPSNTVQEYWPLLRAGKQVKRGFLGIRYTALDADIAEEFGIAGGLQIGALAKQGDAYAGPAHQAGLRQGDIITHVDTQSVTTTREFRHIVEKYLPGTKVKINVLRPQSAQTGNTLLTVTLGDWPTLADTGEAASPGAPTGDYSKSGLLLKDVAELTQTERESMQLSTQITGTVITGVLPGSAADKAQINRGLKIIRARLNNNTWSEINSKGEFMKLEQALLPQEKLLVVVSDNKDTQLYKLITLP